MIYNFSVKYCGYYEDDLYQYGLTQLNTLVILINLTRRLGWTDTEIKMNTYETIRHHGYFIKWTCDVSDAGSGCIH